MNLFQNYKQMKTNINKKPVKWFPFWESGFAENRSCKIPFLSFHPTGFSELRNAKVKPTVSEATHYDKKFHDHPEIEPSALTPDHKDAIINYTSMPTTDKQEGHGSSGNINAYLRNRGGDKSSFIKGHTESDVHKSVEKLSSAFTKENTNGIAVHTYGAVPDSVGEALEKSKPGTIHNLPGFISTSSNIATAKAFSSIYQEKKQSETEHLVRYNLEPGTGLSAAKYSEYPEDEVILHHGSNLRYDKTVSDDLTKIHHVTVLPGHKPLTDYGRYSPE